jgi:hypothetical protein
MLQFMYSSLDLAVDIVKHFLPVWKLIWELNNDFRPLGGTCYVCELMLTINVRFGDYQKYNGRTSCM